METDPTTRSDLRTLNEQLEDGGWTVAKGHTYSHAGQEIIGVIMHAGHACFFTYAHLVTRVPLAGLRVHFSGGGGQSEIRLTGPAPVSKDGAAGRSEPGAGEPRIVERMVFERPARQR